MAVGAVVHAGRRGFADIHEWPSGEGRFGLAIDVSDRETLRTAMARETETVPPAPGINPICNSGNWNQASREATL